MITPGFQSFLHESNWNDIPEPVREFARRCLLDLIGVMAAGSQTKLSELICSHVKEHFSSAGKSASIMLDGAKVSPLGAALANGMMIDSIDAHDGFKQAKGHIGCHLLPTLFAFYQAEGKRDGREFLTDLVIGYEIGARSALALHASAPDYHTSGAWGAVTSAALGSRILGFDANKTRHAIGIGEYHGPRSQMMRCIDHPTMLKDGSGWGAMAGVSATYLAGSGFTGAPAITVEGDEVAEFWQDLGSRWTIVEQYFKPYPVCRWAQPATEAALTVQKLHKLSHEDIDHIEVFSFHEACRLATWNPTDTEQAQYSLPFPVSAALVFGTVGPKEISDPALQDERVLRLANSMVLSEHEPYNEIFPHDRLAHVKVHLRNGDVLTSETHRASGDPETPLSDEDIREKFRWLAEPVISQGRALQIETVIDGLGEVTQLDDLLKLITRSIDPADQSAAAE